MQTDVNPSELCTDVYSTIRETDSVNELLAYDVIGDVQTAILRCELAKSKLQRYPISSLAPRCRGELVAHLRHHLFFLRKTLSSLQEATTHG